MTTINLKDFYPWYTHDEYIEVSEKVADELRASRLYEAAYQRRIVRNKAQYSLDCEDGIEYSACISEPTPQELLERMELFCHLCAALNSLPETQGRRVDACVILGKSYREVAEAEGMQVALSLPVKSAILIDQNTGTVRYEMNADEKLPPASITKIMSLLLFMEALDSGKIALTDTVTCSEVAAGFGGSQIWLKPGEEMTVDDLLKAVAVQSANDATVCLAEYVAGSEEAFVQLMNQKAAELGMENTHFACCAGLDNEGHYSTARDIALMSRALLRYPKITDYTTIWMDTLRNGATSLVNTNRLVRFYQGATGLKTGTTNGAGCCLSASASRDGLGLIAVVLGAGNSNDRFAAARALLDWGYANLAAVNITPPELEPLAVIRGTAPTVELTAQPPAEGIVIPKGQREAMTQTVNLAESLEAPIAAGTEVGTVTVTVEGQTVASYPVVTAAAVERMTFGRAFQRLGQGLLAMG